MDRPIICAQCPGIYSESEITGRQDETEKPLVEILGADAGFREGNLTANRPTRTSAWKRLFGKDPGRTPSRTRFDSETENQARALVNLDRLAQWTFTCPNGHEVDGNRGLQIPMGVVGPSGASKSHFLPALIFETDRLMALRTAQIRLEPAPFTATELEYMVGQIYEKRAVLDPTPPDEVKGPFGYRLQIKHGNSSKRFSLLLFDVGGEALSSITRIRERAPFVLLAKALIVLIDPQDVFETRFDSAGVAVVGTDRVVAAARVRRSIAQVVDALEELWGRSMQEIPIPVCLALAKADSMTWAFDWDKETERVLEHAQDDLHLALTESSSAVRDQLHKNGGALLVEDVEQRFHPDRTRWVAVSATSEMPRTDADGHPIWSSPTPKGASLALLHILDLLGHIVPRETSGD